MSLGLYSTFKDLKYGRKKMEGKRTHFQKLGLTPASPEGEWRSFSKCKCSPSVFFRLPTSLLDQVATLAPQSGAFCCSGCVQYHNCTEKNDENTNFLTLSAFGFLHSSERISYIMLKNLNV